MTLQECYAAIGGDYDGVVSRLRSERLVKKFVLKFVDDKSYELLCQSLQTKNAPEAFRAAHTIKGMCQNLGFSKLQDSSTRMAELLRSDWNDAAVDLLGELTADYQQTVDAIRGVDA
ncbi:MAG: Hpt domain-containing protein [Anaerotruncus sp.]|jgi:HPt (histidine-containing phosphotransfer) domain-containing protein|nr:Hpt domain-containing protein [Anaerotruncus sp.]